jgi:integrase
MIEAMLIARVREHAPSLIPRRAPLLRDFAPRFLKWVDECRLEPGSKLYYQKGWRMLKPTDLVGMRLDEITTDVAARFDFPGSPSNVNRALRTLRRMLGKAAEWGVIGVAPRIKLVKEHGRGMLIDQDAEMKLMVVAKQPLKDVLIIVLDAGLRPASEVFLLRWEYIDWQCRTIFIPFGKTDNARRRVAMTQRMADALLARIPKKPEGWVFPSKRS